MTIREATKLSNGKELDIAYPIRLRDKKGRPVYIEESYGVWSKREYNENGRTVYYENSDGYWTKREHDENGKEVYYENSRGIIINQRTKEMTVAEIEAQLGHKVKIVKEEK